MIGIWELLPATAHVSILMKFNCSIIRLDVLWLPQVQSINMALDFSNI